MTSVTKTIRRGFTWCHGAVVRGVRNEKRLALVFTGGDYGEGADEILDALAAHRARGSFFLTGDFVRTDVNAAAVHRIVAEGHCLGPHSDKHLLYCPWEDRQRTLVSRQVFEHDWPGNVRELESAGWARQQETWWIPPYEWYNEEIVAWSEEMGFRLFCFTPGTRSHTDYMTDDDPHFVPSDRIVRSVLDYEEREPDGLNGFLLLFHVGAGPGRSDKFFRQLPGLLVELAARGYAFVRVDELLREAPCWNGAREKDVTA